MNIFKIPLFSIKKILQLNINISKDLVIKILFFQKSITFIRKNIFPHKVKRIRYLEISNYDLISKTILLLLINNFRGCFQALELDYLFRT